MVGMTVDFLFGPKNSDRRRPVQDKLGDIVSAKDFGAIGDNIADDTAAITAALLYAKNNGKRTVYLPAGRYRVSTELFVENVCLIGDGAPAPGTTNGTEIIATAAMTSVIKPTALLSEVSHLRVNGNGLATYGIAPFGNGLGLIDSVFIEYAKVDGIYIGVASNNIAIEIHRCFIRNNGTRLAVGTGSAAANSTMATLTGAPDLTGVAPQIRPMVDYIQLDGDIARPILSFSSNTVTTSYGMAFPATVSGKTATLIRGNGITVAAHADNSCVKILNTTIQNSAGAAIRSAALYAIQSKGGIYEANEIGIHVGSADNVTGNYGFVAVEDYYEICGSAHLYLESCIGGIVRPSYLDGGWDKIVHTGYIFVSGVDIVIGAVTASGQQVDQVNITTAHVDFGQTHHYTQSAAATDFTINLPAIPPGGRKAKVFGATDLELKLVFHDIGGKTATIKSPDSLVNGIAGTSGYAHTGNHKILTAMWSPAWGWTVA